jgi:hypothetical protein
MSNGIVMVVFGEQYDAFAAHCVAYSRKYTDLPVTVITNTKNNRSIKWQGLKNIEFVEFDLPQDQNRQVKTSLINYTPFEKTLYLDCDAIIQRPGIEKIFDLIISDRLLVNIYGRWSNQSKAPALYRRAFLNSMTQMPINIYYGAIMGFTKTQKIGDFFALWNKYWKLNGSGREMPALACAIKNSGIEVKEINRRNGWFSWPLDKNAIVQHEYGRHIRRLVGCPDFKAYKPFDRKQVVCPA